MGIPAEVKVQRTISTSPRVEPMSKNFLWVASPCVPRTERLKDAKLVSDATGNYSYISHRSSGQKYLMLGNAFAFIDPVFSCGVFLAMNSGFVGADAIDTCLKEPQNAAAA